MLQILSQYIPCLPEWNFFRSLSKMEKRIQGKWSGRKNFIGKSEPATWIFHDGHFVIKNQTKVLQKGLYDITEDRGRSLILVLKNKLGKKKESLLYIKQARGKDAMLFGKNFDKMFPFKMLRKD